MKVMRLFHAFVACLALSGCANPISELNQAPVMSPIGYGLQADARAIPVERRGRFERKDLYRDARAARTDDVLWRAVISRPRKQLDHLGFVIVGRESLCLFIGFNSRRADQGPRLQKLLRQSHSIGRILMAQCSGEGCT